MQKSKTRGLYKSWKAYAHLLFCQVQLQFPTRRKSFVRETWLFDNE